LLPAEFGVLSSSAELSPLTDPRDDSPPPVSEVDPPEPAPADDDGLDELDPVEPGEPVVSAKATAGMDPIAAPTPSAIASAPTRPTWRA
jgi:hypothetical protein